MNKQLLDKAKEVVFDTAILINLVSKRTKQLNEGYAPLISDCQDMEPEEIALQEIIEKKVYSEEK